MKKANYVLLLIFLLTFNQIQAQEEEKESKFNIIGYGGIGYGIVENKNEPNYNLSTNNGVILLNYSISQKFGIATGFGLNELSGNGFNSIGNFYHERTIHKIPLLATYDINVSEKLKMIANFGFYTQNIAKDEYQYLNNTHKDVYDGWNWGGQIGLGFVIKMTNNFSAGVNYTAQSDFSKFKTNNNEPINDEQILVKMNSIGIILQIKF